MKQLVHTFLMVMLTSVPSFAKGAFAERVIDLTNEQRRRYGLTELEEASALTWAAQAHASDQIRRGYFDHTTPEGVTVATRVRRAGYDGRGGWENLYSGWGGRTGTPEAAVRSWMNSPGHRANILDPRVEEIGVGIAVDKSGKAVYVQNFGDTQ